MYTNYIFDLYGTLIDINTNEYAPELWDKMVLIFGYNGADYTADELFSEYNRLVEREKQRIKRLNPDCSYIDIELDRVFKKLYTQKNANPKKTDILFTAKAMRCYSTNYIKLYDGVTDLLESLKGKGKKVYLLSNAQRCFTESELRMFDLEKYFDGICISSDEKCSKPDKKFFEILFDRYALDKSKSVMIGNDSVSDILGAYNFGIDSLYIHQSISPEISDDLKANYKVLDGDVYKIKKILLKD